MSSAPLPSGRAFLLFGAIMIVLGLWVSVVLNRWLDSALWYALGSFFLCFSALMHDSLKRWHRLLLVVGLGSGLIAFGFALRMAGVIG